jgi:hypothetical protein
MSLRLVYEFVSGEFLRLQLAERAKMARAATAAVHDAGELAKKGGRASIAAAGFSAKWQNALRADYFPKGRDSLSPAALIYHKIEYSEAFEEGSTIDGKPLLWLPLPNVPLGAGGKQLTPQQFVARIGPLASVNLPGKPPLLVGRGSLSGILRATNKSVRVRKRALRGGNILGEEVPLYIGLPDITDPKKFDVVAAINDAAADLGELYLKYFEEA